MRNGGGDGGCDGFVDDYGGVDGESLVKVLWKVIVVVMGVVIRGVEMLGVVRIVWLLIENKMW